METDNVVTLEPEARSGGAKDKRKRLMQPYGQFASQAKRLLVTEPQLAELIGYSRSIVLDWTKTGFAPQTAVLAAECLIRRQSRQATSYALVRLHHGTMEIVGEVAEEEPAEIRLGGKVYWMIERP